MKILHTSDWHVGKVLKGHSRLDEHVAVLNDLVGVARAERPDLVIVAGDLFDTAAPTADARRVVVRALTALRRASGALVAVAGNHDNGADLEALRTWATSAGIELRGTVGRDLVVEGESAAGEPWRCVALPWLSQRYAVRATEMFDLTAAEATQSYADHVARVLAQLTAGFTTDAVNIVAAHLTVVGAVAGGGEREAHTIQQYAVPATVFPSSTHYVALGHLHRHQAVAGPAPAHYSGSPIAVDFGEEENTPGAVLVDVSPDTPARVRHVPLPAARRLRTVRGTLDQLAALDPGDDWLRVYVTERPRAGLREDVHALLPHALEVRVDPDLAVDPTAPPRAQRSGRSSRDLFAAYLAERGHDDPAVADLFDRLYAEVS